MIEILVVPVVLIVILAYVAQKLTPQRSTRYGSARLEKAGRFIRRSFKGWVVDGVRQLRKTDSINLLCISSTGGGKTTNLVIPNILKLSDNMLITDVKGELVELTAPALHQKGYAVQVLNLNEPTTTIRYNPLALLQSEEEIKAFCSQLFFMASGGKNRTEAIWRVLGENMLYLLIVTVKSHPKKAYATIGSCIDLLNGISTNPDVPCETEAIVRRIAPTHIRDRFLQMKYQSDVKVLQGCLSQCLTLLAPFDSLNMRTLMSDMELEFSDLRTQKTALYIQTSIANNREYAPFITLLMSSIFSYLLDTPVKKTDRDVFIIMDEFANLRPIQNISEVFSLLRSQRCRIGIFIQNISQLKYVYGAEVMHTILSNCLSQVVLGGVRDEETLRLISSFCGEMTHIETSLDQIHPTKRAVITKDEIRRLQKGTGLLLHGNKNPIRLRLRAIFENYVLMRKNGLRSVEGQLVSKLKMPETLTPKRITRSKEIEEPIDISPDVLELRNQNKRSTNPFFNTENKKNE